MCGFDRDEWELEMEQLRQNERNRREEQARKKDRLEAESKRPSDLLKDLRDLINNKVKKPEMA